MNQGTRQAIGASQIFPTSAEEPNSLDWWSAAAHYATTGSTIAGAIAVAVGGFVAFAKSGIKFYEFVKPYLDRPAKNPPDCEPIDVALPVTQPSPAQMHVHSASLLDLPTEIILLITDDMNFTSTLSFSSCNKSLRQKITVNYRIDFGALTRSGAMICTLDCILTIGAKHAFTCPTCSGNVTLKDITRPEISKHLEVYAPKDINAICGDCHGDWLEITRAAGKRRLSKQSGPGSRLASLNAQIRKRAIVDMLNMIEERQKLARDGDDNQFFSLQDARCLLTAYPVDVELVCAGQVQSKKRKASEQPGGGANAGAHNATLATPSKKRKLDGQVVAIVV